MLAYESKLVYYSACMRSWSMGGRLNGIASHSAINERRRSGAVESLHHQRQHRGRRISHLYCGWVVVRAAGSGINVMVHDGTGCWRFMRSHKATCTSRCFPGWSPHSWVSICAKSGAGTGNVDLPAADLPEGWGIDRFPCSRLSPLDCFREGMYDCERSINGCN